MFKGISVGLTVVTMLVASCSSSEEPNDAFSCETAKSKCPADGMIPKEICDMLKIPACNTIFLEFASCAVENQICKKDDMTTDFPATIKMCQTQYDKAQACNDMYMDGGKRD
jgi:hypothetical protein